MPRKPRLFVPQAIYHVYCRVARGEYVFDDPVEAESFLGCLRSVRDGDRWSLLAWCLMSNHYHVVLRTRDVPLWRSMARLQRRVARGHNRRHRYLGRLWQSRYKARIIDTGTYLQQVIAYVHLNPVEANLVDDPCEYPLCGHREALGIRTMGLLDRGGLLDAFPASTRDESLQIYALTLRAVAEERWFRKGIDRLPWWRDIENSEEIGDPKRHVDATTFDEVEVLVDRPMLNIEELAGGFEETTEYSVSALSTRSRQRHLVEGRILFCCIAVGIYGLRVCDVAEFLNKNPGSVSRWLTQADRRRQSDLQFQSLVDATDRAIAERHWSNVTM